MILYFDTETTGLHPGQICQLSYILQTKEKVIGKNFFFTVDYVEPSAQMVHGFSKQKLEFLSNGKRFADYFEQIRRDFESADLVVSHNVAFDFSFMRTEYERLNQIFKVKNEFCSMKKATPICCLKRSSGNGYKYPKLQELCSFTDVSDSEIQKIVKDFYGQDIGFHDARFDTIAVYLCVNKLIQKDVFGELDCYL